MLPPVRATGKARPHPFAVFATLDTAAGVAVRPAPCGGEGLMASSPVALQLWTVRERFAVDADRTLAEVKAAGFSAVELAPILQRLTPDVLAESLARHCLTVTSIHGDLPTPATISGWADLAHLVCGCSKLSWHGWPRDPRFDSFAGVRELITECNAAAALARDQGLSLGLHNHWWEFETVEGVRPIRLLNAELHPDVFWQLDVYWAQTAGADPATVVAELGTRVRSIHWKDGPCVHGQPMVALGRGRVDVPRIARALTHSVDWVIELDECATDPLEAARQGRVYLESLGV
jgi:sugar phosphate isomerase/epimerase